MIEPGFDELLSQHLDGSLDANEQQRFAEMLRDPQLAKRYVVSCQMHAMLAWEHGTMPVLERPVAQSRPSHHLRWGLGIAVAASVIVLAAMSLVPRESAPATTVAWQDRPPAGRVVKSHGGRLSVPELSLQLHEGDALRAGDYQLVAGFVQVDIDGVELTVESPARFRIVSDEYVMLETGRMSARVSTSKTSFHVETSDAATAEILSGAETAIEANSVASEIHVFEGDVEILPKTEELPFHLTSHTATRIGRSGAPAGVDLDRDRFTRSLEEPSTQYAPVVLSLDPVIYFRMGSNSDGETLPNDAHANQPGDKVGKVYADRMKRPPFAPGQIGSALRLQSQFGAYAKYPAYPMATESLTACAWVKAASRPRWASIAKHWTKNVGQFQFGFHGDDGDLEIQVLAAGGDKVSVRERAKFPLGSWQFVAFVADGQTLRLYRNGNEIGSAPCDGLDSQGTSDLGIGVKLGSDGKPAQHNPGFWDGRIDELAIFQRPLTVEQINLLYESGVEQNGLLAFNQHLVGQGVGLASSRSSERSSLGPFNSLHDDFQKWNK